MPGCVLRATGDSFQVENFLEVSSLVPCNIFIKGERKASNRLWDTCGITIVVSDSDGSELATQIRDAIEFLRNNRDELFRLRNFDGVEVMELDFGIYRKNGFLQSNLFPAELIVFAGDLQIGIELSIFGEVATSF
jgi:hypothetical protein